MASTGITTLPPTSHYNPNPSSSNMQDIQITITTSSSSGSRSNPFLPHQLILHHILARLPPKYLFQCSCVCKLWFTSILRDPHFAASHFLQYSQKNPCLLYKFGGQGETDSFYLSSESDGGYVDLHKIETIGSQHQRELIGSCNGLVCLFDVQAQIIEVCNSTRRQILAIFPPRPIMAAANQHSTKSYRFGFGYDSSSEEYKVAFILLETSECMVFSLGTKNAYWSDIAIDKDVLAKLSDDSDDHFESGAAATFCNGALYWSQGKELVSLHLHKEKFQVIQLPGLARFHELFSSRLLVHKGSLCWVNMSAACTSTLRWSVELFVLKQDEGGEQVWKKESFLLPYVSPGRDNQLVGFLDQLLLHRTVMKGQIGIYNLHKRKEKIVRNPRNLLSSVEHWVCSSHVENFLSLQTFVQQGVTCVKGINF